MTNQTQQPEPEQQGSIFGKIKIGIYILIGLYILSTVLGGFFGGSGESYTETEVLDPTQGVVTEVKEFEEAKFHITNETIVPTKEESRIIASYLDGTVDTLTLDEARLEQANNPRRSAMRSVIMGGMMGYFLGRRMSAPLKQSAYANSAAYNKSKTNTASRLKPTAAKRTVRKPRAASKGFGSGRSTRSFGG